MALIDSTGYLSGERIAACSDEAQYQFPRLMAASNSFGRIKLSYQSIISTAYRSIRKPPTWKQMDSLITEYATNYLLFIYTAPNGETWGQWMTPDHLKGKYPTAADKRSPEPPKDGYELYRQAYVSSLKVKSLGINNIFKPLPTTQNHIDLSKTTPLVVVVDVVEDEVQVQKQNTTTLASTCENPQVPAAADPESTAVAFIQLPLTGNEFFGVTEDLVAEWIPLYPALDVRQELRNMRGWMDGNPRNRKTRSGIRRFIANWLVKSQNRAPSMNYPTSGKEQRNETKWDRLEREAARIMDAQSPAHHG